MDFKAIGTRIRQRRKIEGLTQEELAQKAGLSTMSIRRYEAGERIIPKEAIQSIATSLGTEPFTLVGPDWWDLQIGPEGVKQLNKGLAAIRFLESMGFTVSEQVTKWHDEEVDDDGHTAQIPDESKIILSKDGHTAIFSQAEFEELQSVAKEAIEGRFYKKVLEQQK